jgi:magnesium-protoporphyrin O-methyltransferase
MSFRVEDVLESADTIESAEVVLMNRVVCCSPEGVRLAGVAASLAKRTLVLSFPRNRFLVRVGLSLVNGWLRVARRSFRVYLHAPAALVGAAEEIGLRHSGGGRGRVWEFVALERSA